jgi:hypothetical protein
MLEREILLSRLVNLRIRCSARGLGLSYVGLLVELDFDGNQFRCLALPVLCLFYNTSK